MFVGDLVIHPRPNILGPSIIFLPLAMISVWDGIVSSEHVGPVLFALLFGGFYAWFLWSVLTMEIRLTERTVSMTYAFRKKVLRWEEIDEFAIVGAGASTSLALVVGLRLRSSSGRALVIRIRRISAAQADALLGHIRARLPAGVENGSRA